MKPLRSPNRFGAAMSLLLAVVVLPLASSCAPKNGPQELAQAVSEQDAEIREPSEDRTEKDRLLGEKDRLLSEKDRLLGEKDLMIVHLNELLESNQQQLEDAIQEVVRAKAKQRSVESRAEAAAQMAEAEIALETYRGKLDGRPSSELAQAEQLLIRGNTEFDARNFGGALYLAIQAKGNTRDGMRRLEDLRETGGPGGETPFAPPLAFTVRTTSNLRKGPGREFAVIDTLDSGTTVTGYGARGSWVRVKRDDGTEGWIHQGLLNAG
jgi:hypothetical protein